jgi:DNA gyrase subunit B
VKRGKQEQYVKDEAELSSYLVNVALEDAALHIKAEAPPIQGLALANLAQKFTQVMSVIERLARRYDRHVLEQMIYAPAVTREMSTSRADMASWVSGLDSALRATLNGEGSSYRLTLIEADGSASGIRIERDRHGIAESQEVSLRFFDSPEYAQLVDLGQNLAGLIGDGAFVIRDKERQPIANFREAMEWLIAEARKGQTIQRYKGLGEMNPEQLWETTVNPESRRLMQVRIEDAVAADEIFTTLMGDQVEPRREFIERNALAVANLDV